MAQLDSVAAGMLARVERDGGPDEVAVELPLEIRLNGSPVAVTMRTPGDDLELAAGFLYGEAVVDEAPTMTLPDDLAANTVDARAPGVAPPPGRRFYTTSSCGICGRGALEEVAVDCPRIEGGPRIARGELAALLPLSNHLLCVSGRLGFELVQKAARAGAPILVGVGAPTSLAVELADDRGVTLAGFARGGSVNVYAHPERVA